MTFFGIIWILLLIWAFLKPQIRYMLFLTLLGMVLQSDNVIVFGETAIGAQFFSSAAFIVKSYTYKSRKIDKNITLFFVSILLFIFFFFFNSAFISVEGFNIIQVLMLWVYLWVCYRMAKIAHVIQLDLLNQYYDRLVVFVLIVGTVLLIQMIGLLPNYGLLESLFYNDTVSGICYYHDDQDHSRFTATFLEPSYCAGFLIGSFFYYLKSSASLAPIVKKLIPIFIAILLSRSSTAFGALAIVGILFVFSKGNKKSLKYIVPLGIIAIILLFTSLSFILDDVIFSKMDTGSAMVRENWNLEAMDVYHNYPIFGQGFSTQRASSIICTILAELGAVGMFFYSLMIVVLLAYGFFKKSMPDYYYGATFMVLSAIVCQLIACPDISFCAFWLAVYMFILLNGCKKEAK